MSSPHSGYSCNYNPGFDAAQTCYRYYSTGSFLTVQCSQGTSNKFSYVTIPATITATATPTTTGGSPSRTVAVLQNVIVYAPLIQINWQSTDRPTSTLGSNSTTTSQTGSPTPISSSQKSGGLSQGATIGIAVAAALVGLALVVALALWTRRRRQQRHPKVMPTLPPNPYADKPGPHEIGATYVAEAPTERDAHEIDGLHKGGASSPRYEMAG